jgi:hypothetical protein
MDSTFALHNGAEKKVSLSFGSAFSTMEFEMGKTKRVFHEFIPFCLGGIGGGMERETQLGPFFCLISKNRSRLLPRKRV